MIRASLLALITGSALMAADQSWSIDVRGHLGASSPMTDVDGSDIDGRMSWAGGIDAGFHRPLGDDKLGLVLLAGVFRDVHRAQERNLHLDYTVLGINLAGGLSWRLQEQWHLEGLIHARVGTGDLDGRTENNNAVSGGHGTSTAFGISAGGYYTFPFRLMVGGALGYEVWQGESDVAGGTVDVEGDGLTFGVVVGYAF